MNNDMLQTKTSDASNLEPVLLLEAIPGAILFVDQKGTVLYMNKSAAVIMGTLTHTLFGSNLWQEVPHLMITPLYHAVETTIRIGQSYDIIYCCPLTSITFCVHLSSFGCGVVLFFQEEKKNSTLWQEAYNDRERKGQILLESCADYVTVLTPHGLILDINQRPLREAQVRREGVLGTPLPLFPSWQHAPTAQHQLRTGIEQARNGEVVSFEAQVCPDEDKRIDLAITLTPHFDEGQQVEYIVFTGLDITERVQREERKDTFIGMVSHELRTPLASLKLQTQMLKKKVKKHDLTLIAGPLSLMEKQINTVIRLVEDFLDLAKIQVDALNYEQESVDLVSLLREKLDMVQKVQNTHKIVLSNLATPAPVIGDRDRLGQVILNLINNAIKYSPDANMIEVKMTRTAEAVTMSIRDQGIGIPPQQREKIFERFHRALPSTQMSIPGLGVGLYMVSEIVKHHRGTVTVESTPGKGSTFHVMFPLHHS